MLMKRRGAAYMGALAAWRGEAEIGDAYMDLVSRIATDYGVHPLWIQPSEVRRHDGLNPLLEVVYARTADGQRLPSVRAFDEKRRVVEETVDGELLIRLFREAGQTVPDGSRTLEVRFLDFEKSAKLDVVGRVPRDRLDEFCQNLALDEPVWDRLFDLGGQLNVFVLTRGYAEQLQASGALEDWRDALMLLLSEFDEFDFIRRDDVRITFDSKELFDTVHGGDWRSWWM